MEEKEVVTFGYNQFGILTAKSRNKRVETNEFKALANLYLTQLSSFNNTTKNNKKEEFNLLVGNCVSCHEHVCKGPLRRIKKLYISE